MSEDDDSSKEAAYKISYGWKQMILLGKIQYPRARESVSKDRRPQDHLNIKKIELRLAALELRKDAVRFSTWK